MKTKNFLAVIGAAILAIGCVSTVSGRKTGGVPFIKDSVEGRYERSVDDVFTASKEVIASDGVLVNESILHTETNLVKTAEGKINQRSVYVRVQAVDPKVTSVAVQTRTSAGGSDLDLAHQIEKEIALKLVAR